jgi:hypothetical protein
MSEQFLLVISIGVFLITQTATYYSDKKLYTVLILLITGFGAIYRTLLDGTIYGFAMAGYFGLMVGVIIWGLQILLERQKRPFPDYAIYFASASLCVGTTQIPILFTNSALLAAVFYVVGGKLPALRSSAWIMAISIATYYLLIFH